MFNVIIAVVSALAGALVGTMAERWANNWGKIAVDLDNFEYLDLKSYYYDMPDTTEEDFDEFEFEIKTSVDIYNSKERFVTIKDLEIQLEINNKILDPKINKIITNNKEMETYSNSQFVNVIKINPNEIKRVYFECKIELDKKEKIALVNNDYKLYFKYKEKDSKEKKVSLKKAK